MYSEKIIEIYSKVCDCRSPICANFSEIYNSRHLRLKAAPTASQGDCE